MKKALFFLSLFVAILGGCRGAGNSACWESHRSMYYWSTTFSLDSTKLAFIKQHDISRLYVRYFDVVMRDGEPMPNATIRFDSVAAAPCEIVPVVYIHNDCLKDVSPQQLKELAHKLVTRIKQMCETHETGPLNEIQFDCDWTRSTRNNFFSLLRFIGDEATPCGIEVSSTIRLHQLSQPAPPVAKGTLMVYNTGDMTDISESKPILDRKVVRDYISYLDDYPLQLSAAYPIYRWELLFRNGRFVDLLHYADELPVLNTDSVVMREVSADEILTCKRLIESHRSDCHNEVILFDLNNFNISRYDNEEFKAFFD